MKRIVTVIVVWVTLCLMLGVKSQAAAIATATKDNSQNTIDNLSYNEVLKYSKSNTKKKSAKKTKKKKVAAILKQGSMIAVEQKKKASSKKNSYTQKELRYMTSIIYCEARGESYAGQKAVGIVVMNRKKSDEFPNGIKKVIYQRGQFSPVRSGSFDKALALYDKYVKNDKFKGEMVSCLKAAKEVLEGSTTIKVNGKEKNMKNYLYFSRYISNAKYTLGGHQFR